MRGGAFRRDARVELEAEVLAIPQAIREIRRARAPSIELPAYFALLAAATLYAAVTTRILLAYVAVALLAVIAMLAFRAFHAGHARIRAAAQSSRRCQLRDDGIVLESDRGRAFWDWTAVIGLRETKRALLVDLAGDQTLVLSREGPDADRVRAWLAARFRGTPRAPKERLLLLNALLYGLIVLAVLRILPGFVPLP
ncbi:MAG: hypothetical protein M3Y87_05680 [Myxococcota bacterium]|nr:hypothetical protein [Myxococcota bacterium]